MARGLTVVQGSVYLRLPRQKSSRASHRDFGVKGEEEGLHCHCSNGVLEYMENV
ncbi:hypothetical protein HanPI659440_Chr08g0294051 [Helianthus annuus]|nr:hypothetical protein HanPI659440_Chr08g0294051 [Helianthus annuus]